MANWKYGKTQYGFLSTATSGGTLTLTASSKQIQIFTGSLAHTMKLPDATTTSNGSGISFTVINQSTGAITVQDNGSNLIATVAAGASADFLLTSVSTANGVWRASTFASSGGGGEGFAGIASVFTSVVANTATGGVITSANGMMIHTFTSGGTFTPVTGISTINYLAVGGGGGGGTTNATASPGGGGGAGGGVLSGTGAAVTLGTGYVIVIGAGGAGAATGVNPSFQGSNGSNTTIATLLGGLTAGGGGGAGSYNTAVNGLAGSATNGNGGGGSTNGTGGAGNGSGFAGGNGFAGLNGAGGGGGGAGGVGANAPDTNHGGAGGVGFSSSIATGGLTSAFYAGGGGGAGPNGAAGGSGGGGNGGSAAAGTAGTANTGGGGGGNCANVTGQAGGSGIVIISYPIVNTYSIVTGDKGKVLDVDTTLGGYTFTLPAPVLGFLITIKDYTGNSATNNIIVLPNGSETIDNASSDTISEAYRAVTYISDGVNWWRMSCFSGSTSNTPSSYAPAPAAGRGFWAGGYNSGGSADSNVIDYVTIATTSNALSFGNLSIAKSQFASCASSTRGINATGFLQAGSVTSNTIDYITMATIGNASSFGTLSTGRAPLAGLSNSIRGIFAGGNTNGEGGGSGTQVNTIDYITIATLGNGTSFGVLTSARENSSGCASSTRGIVAGGQVAAAGSALIEYVTIASTGNSTSFGNLNVDRKNMGGCSNATRGLFGGGNSTAGGGIVATIEYITIATLGNGTSFGNLTGTRRYLSQCASSIRALFGAGQIPTTTATIEYVVIATTANSVSFGNLTQARTNTPGCFSNVHGGL